ncbi:hypothetical protein Pla100_27880 [Neorhodopirellula pilleata]|uniref:Secreted protein n=1 Tax=Neorhodopirellula pilleata TaxID=2714738 RepID=A0A5C6AB81_9BACT|nr:hypothetical protein Pla100_27880 [Neorhodopirellula pilleata]
MKPFCLFLMIFILVVASTGCGNSSEPVVSDQAGLEALIQENEKEGARLREAGLLDE